VTQRLLVTSEYASRMCWTKLAMSSTAWREDKYLSAVGESKLFTGQADALWQP
jgi:hypothetical protein